MEISYARTRLPLIVSRTGRFLPVSRDGAKGQAAMSGTNPLCETQYCVYLHEASNVRKKGTSSMGLPKIIFSAVETSIRRPSDLRYIL